MSNIGICEYVIGVIHDKDIWYYVGEYDADGKKLEPRRKYSSFLIDAKRYDDMDLLRDDLESLHESVTRKILEIQRCPKCKKEFTEYPACLAWIMRRRFVRNVESRKLFLLLLV